MLLNVSQWQEIDLKVLGEIHLDEKNVRLEHSDNKVEADLLQDLFANENVLDLVSRIASVGFLTHELPVAVKRQRKYVVVEGNRRVAALKAIQNPMLVPDYQARIKDIVSTIPKGQLRVLASVRVRIAPNADQANQLIAALHTGEQRRGWTPARQAAFFQAQIDAGRTYDELVTRYPTVNVAEFVFRSHVLRLIRDADFAEPELRDYVASKDWRRSTSTLERIYEKRAFLDLTGVRMERGKFKHNLTADQVNAIATIIVRGMKDKNLNTRSINTIDSPRFKQLITDLRQAVGLPVSGAQGGAAGAGGGGGGPAPGPSPRPTPTPPRPRTKPKEFLEVSVTVPASWSLALHKQFEELTILNYVRMPHTAYLALRAVLEKSIKQYAELLSIDIATDAGINGYVQLHHALEWYDKRVTANGPKSLVQPIRKLTTGKTLNYGSNYSSRKDALDAVNHNHKYLVSPSEVLDLWNSIDPLLRELTKP